MAKLRQLTKNAPRPQGFWGKLMLLKMNHGHARLIRWALSQVEIGPDDRVLDIGCGGGRALKEMAARLEEGSATGVDHAPDAVAASLKKNKKAVKTGRVRVLEASVSKLPFRGESFTLATAFETVYFWPNLPGDFVEARRVLRPGGELLIGCEMYKGQPGEERFRPVVEQLDMHVFYPQELIELLRQAGFIDIRLYLEEKEGWMVAVGKKAGHNRRQSGQEAAPAEQSRR